MSGNSTHSIPSFIIEAKVNDITIIDTVVDIASGIDPFPKIMDVLLKMPREHVLLIISSNEPTDLITILKEKGFEYFTKVNSDATVCTYLKNGNH